MMMMTAVMMILIMIMASMMALTTDHQLRHHQHFDNLELFQLQLYVLHI